MLKKNKTIGAVVPVLRKLGGVRFFLEIGNELISRGYDYTIFTDTGEVNNLDWFDYKGKIADWKDGISADILLIGDPFLLPATNKMIGKIYVWVIASGEYKSLYDTYYGKFPFLLNNRWFKKDYPNGIICENGVNVKHFKPKKRRVLYYSGGAHKQGHIIKEQLGDLENIELIELKNLNDDELVQAYHDADYFVSWEMQGGWSNTSAEALACGIPVVTNGNNCESFIDRVIVVKSLRDFFKQPMEDNSWEYRVDTLLEIIN